MAYDTAFFEGRVLRYYVLDHNVPALKSVDGCFCAIFRMFY
jgi:hypothetical protein